MSPGRNIVIYRLLPIKGLKPHFLNYYLLVNNGSRNLATCYKILYNTVLHALQKTKYCIILYCMHYKNHIKDGIL
jgi:hypothetical protein